MKRYPRRTEWQMEKNGTPSQGLEDPAHHLAIDQRLAAGQIKARSSCAGSMLGGDHRLRHVVGVDRLAASDTGPNDR